MKVAIDNVDLIDKLKDYELVYVYEKMSWKEIKQLGISAINKEYADYIADINLTNFEFASIKRAKIDDKDWNKLPEKKDYKFSIIVPNYNNYHGNYKNKTYLENCIDSILNQTYKNFELIVVDDCSTDGSVKYLEKIKDKRLRLIRNKRKRYNGGSRNVGIEAVENDTDYICFLDSDDWWKDENVLQTINDNLYGCEMMLLGLECINDKGVFLTKINKWNNPKELFISSNTVWCTAWARVIRKDKIVYFCEDTLMEDRVWSYRQTDNVEYNNVKNLKKVMYVWNRTNTENSVSITRNGYWDASAWCHIGHQKQLLTQLKHKEYKTALEERIRECINKVNAGTYMQY